MAKNDILDDFEFDADPFFEDGSKEVVAKYYSPLEAEVAASRLRSEGIPCFLANSTAQSVLPHLHLLIRLHVLPEDLDRAREILTEAAIDAQVAGPEPKDAHVLTLMAVGIGLLLALMLVKAMWGIF
ncbi:MAG: DUF2007 domain-containing protein [Saprospiraceae bacterium]|nr:DUF2007 domain-containing protein [Saprospiraceae bacterium]